ncbi:MAG: TonB-dependent receptor [Candidatus Andeanibacterium colombiense]|uniref:TonB-dependent receptor n=1 Tax=Candidatus Andeanibacterium colombiense TaxID=3121345 RepID=A0AAJ5X8X3_9SPHN|nr:MAG: TonB-dependent receptor [Sphingomonadaceae bacterium]
MKIRTHLKGAAAPVALAVALLAQPAFAQDGADPAPALTTDDLKPATVVEDDANDAIVVTGSRIRRSETTSASPIQIIDPEISRKAGRNDTAEIIQNSPIASGSSQITAAISSNAISNGGPGAATISLRGLGAERTLVLLNSRRAGPAGTRGGVSSFDLNVLPSSIIQSVEILKDGASSVYGSDAIAGVVNIITKTKTDGLELNGFTSLPTAHGGEQYTLSGAWGKEWDRGHVLLAGEYFKQKQVRRKDRDYLDCDYDYLFRGKDTGKVDGDGNPIFAGTDERIDLIDPRTGTPFCDGAPWGHVWTYYASNVPQTSASYTLLQYSYGNDNLGHYVSPVGPAVNPGDISTPAGWYPVGSRTPVSDALVNSYSPIERKSTVIPEIERYTAYLDASFDLTDAVSLYAEGLYNHRRSYVDSYSQFYNFGYTGLYPAGDPDDPFPGFGSTPGSHAFISPTGILDNYDNQITVDYYRAVLGATGKLTDTINFDVYGQYSRSDGKYRLDQILQDVITQQTERAYGAGCAGLFSEITNKPCLQINWVDPRVMAGDLTQEEEDYLTGTETGRTLYVQKFVEASINGPLVNLPAGPLAFALGATIRRDSIDDLPGDITRALIPGGDPNNEDDYVDNGFANNYSSGHTYGHGTTKEVFGEVEIPIFKDQPFAKNFTISAAGRVTNVTAVRGQDGFSDSSNGNVTYKFMANWQITDWVRLRGTYGTSYRAPALFEQLLASQSSRARQTIDPCVNWADALAKNAITQRIADNCAADGIPSNHGGGGIQATVFSSGGIGVLDPETSKAWTASVILTPRFSFLPNTTMDLTVDYFDIRVNGEIAQLSPTSILRSCYDAVDFPNSPFCDLFERGQDGNPDNIKNVFQKFINVDEQVNRGLDFTFRVRQDMGRAGRITLLAQATLQTKDTALSLGTFEDYNGEVGDPKFTADVNLTWDVDDWSFYYGVDMIGKSSSVRDYIEDFGALCGVNAESQNVYGGSYCVRPYTPAVFYHSMSITKEFQDRFELTLGVSNLFNTRPPQISGLTEIGSSPFVSNYDWQGQRWFASVGAKF